MLIFKNRIGIVVVSFTLGAWAQFYWINDLSVIFESMERYGAGFVLIAAIIAWVSVQSQIRAAKQLNAYNEIKDQLSAMKCVAFELTQNAVVFDQLEKLIGNRLSDDFLEKYELALHLIDHSENLLNSMSDNLFLSNSRFVTRLENDAYNVVSSSYMQIGQVRSQLGLIKTPILWASKNEEEQDFKGYFRELLELIIFAKTRFRKASEIAFIEISAIEIKLNK